MNKDKIKIILGIIILVIFNWFLSIFFYKFFSKNSVIVSNLEIAYSDTGDGLITNGNVKTFSAATPYVFQVKNNGQVDGKYKVVINDDVKSNIDRKNLRYQLTLNNNVIKTGEMSEIENNILDTRMIEANQTNYYTLKVIIKDNVNTNGDYKYSLKVIPIL